MAGTLVTISRIAMRSASRGDAPTGLLRFVRPSLRTMMLLAVALVGALATWDEARGSTAALEDFTREQSTLTQVTASGLAAQLEVVRRDALAIADDAPRMRRAGGGGRLALARTRTETL